MKARTAPGLLLFSLVFLISSPLSLAQQVPGGMTLKQFSSELHRIATPPLLSTKPETLTSLARAISSDQSLAKHAIVRANAGLLLSDLQALRSLEDQFNAGSQSQFNTPGTQVVSGNNFDPRKEARLANTRTNKRNKLLTENLQKQTEIEASIKKRLAAINAQIETPLGQQFLLPADSQIVVALRPPILLDPRPGSYQRFEVISITADGFLGYLLKALPPQSGTRDPAFAADRSETFIVRGYTKPVTMGERLRIRVVPGATVTIDGMSVKEFIAREAPSAE